MHRADPVTRPTSGLAGNLSSLLTTFTLLAACSPATDLEWRVWCLMFWNSCASWIRPHANRSRAITPTTRMSEGSHTTFLPLQSISLGAYLEGPGKVNASSPDYVTRIRQLQPSQSKPCNHSNNCAHSRIQRRQSTRPNDRQVAACEKSSPDLVCLQASQSCRSMTERMGWLLLFASRIAKAGSSGQTAGLNRRRHLRSRVLLSLLRSTLLCTDSVIFVVHTDICLCIAYKHALTFLDRLPGCSRHTGSCYRYTGAFFFP